VSGELRRRGIRAQRGKMAPERPLATLRVSYCQNPAYALPHPECLAVKFELFHN
jgi:hypothetical protein